MLVRERRWGMTFCALLSVVLLLQFLLAALLGVRGVQTLLISRGDLRLEVTAGAADPEVQQLYASLKELPYVDSVVYVPQEQAYEQQRVRDPNLVTFLDKYKLQNPFPNTFAITLLSLEHYETLRTFIGQPRWKSVIQPASLTTLADQEQKVRSLLQITRAVGTLSEFLVLLLCVSLALVLTELIRRRTRQRADELVLERLLGSSDIDILLPFVTEMALFLLLSFVAGSALVTVAVWFLPTLFDAFLEGPFLALHRELWRLIITIGIPLLLLEILLAPVLAWGGAVLGMRGR